MWVRFPGMTLVWYDEILLLAMASAIGRPIKVDRQTLRVERGRFASVCVEIDLNQPVVGKFWMRDRWFNIEYEGLHVICSNCGCYGHVTRNCPVQKEAPVAKTAAVGKDKEVTGQSNEKGDEPGMINGDNTSVPKEKEVDMISNNEPKNVEPTHGDWLAVSRKKRNNKGDRINVRIFRRITIRSLMGDVMGWLRLIKVGVGQANLFHQPKKP